MIRTITIRLADLHQTAKQRPRGYIEHVLSAAVVVTETHYVLELEVYQELCKRYRRAGLAWPVVSPYLALWREIHTAELAVDQREVFIKHVLERLPCGECRDESRLFILLNPPVFGEGWFAWTVAWHNNVRRRQGKPELTLVEAEAAWRPAAEIS